MTLRLYELVRIGICKSARESFEYLPFMVSERVMTDIEQEINCYSIFPHCSCD